MSDSEFAAADDATLVTAIAECTRAEAAMAARRLAATAELTARYTDPDPERERMVIDGWRLASAEVSAAMGTADRAASGQMCIAMALRERLPRVAALFAQGRLSAKLVATITWRTHLIVDAEIQERIDSAIADRAVKWGPLSVAKLESAIDSLVDVHDPDARRRLREAARSRDVLFGKPDDVSGTRSMWGRLLTSDAELFERRLAHMLSGVCAADPRTAGQRRSDAMGAIAVGADRLTCQCGDPNCPSAGDDPRATSFVINLIAEPPALDAKPDPRISGDGEVKKPAAESAKPNAAAALILGGGVIPTPLLAELIKNGAKVQWVHKPDAIPETGYRPSRKTARFVRMRDMTCRFPGCDKPAEHCDIDHTTPYPAGVTHPSNTKCLCRIHHLLKTFERWLDEQRPDGSIIWTAPSGATYVTHPGSRLFFPDWEVATVVLPSAEGSPDGTDKGEMMPRRRRTRAEDRLRGIERERRLNAHDRNRYTQPVAAKPSRPPPDNPCDNTIDTGTNDPDTDPPPF
jgi:hypothetical protein